MQVIVKLRKDRKLFRATAQTLVRANRTIWSVLKKKEHDKEQIGQEETTAVDGRNSCENCRGKKKQQTTVSNIINILHRARWWSHNPLFGEDYKIRNLEARFKWCKTHCWFNKGQWESVGNPNEHHFTSWREVCREKHRRTNNSLKKLKQKSQKTNAAVCWNQWVTGLMQLLQGREMQPNIKVYLHYHCILWHYIIITFIKKYQIFSLLAWIKRQWIAQWLIIKLTVLPALLTTVTGLFPSNFHASDDCLMHERAGLCWHYAHQTVDFIIQSGAANVPRITIS